MIRADLHSHTKCSHGLATAGEMLATAAETGLDYFAISEHSPLPPGYGCALYTGDLERDFPLLIRELVEMKRHKPGLLLGLELDWTPSAHAWMRDIVSSAPFDHVLGSLHFLDGKSVGNPASWPASLSRAEHFERFEAYYYEMASMCKSGLINIASHPDFIKIRVFELFHEWLDSPEAEKAIFSALVAMKKHDVALEINSAGLRQPFREMYPCSKIMRLAKQARVNISFGSDAHRPEDIAAAFEEARLWAMRHGYTDYVVYFKGRPRSFKL